MLGWCDILTYAVMVGFVFAALCAITRGGRTGPWRGLGLGVIVGVDVLLEGWYCSSVVPLDRWLAVFFAVAVLVFIGLVIALSRDRFGRRLFLAINYGAYFACYVPVFHAVTYRNVFGLSEALACAAGIVVISTANLVFLYWVLPQVPRDDRDFPWRTPCLVAGAMLVSLGVCGVWPVSLVTAPARFCLPFVLTSVLACVGFPLLCRYMRDRLRTRAIEHGLELMTTEVKVRRAAIDEARRIRHDHRHHRIVLGGLLLQGKTKEALAYLNALDAENAELSSSTRIWCENETINAILAGCSRKAEAKGVAFSAEAHVDRLAPLPDTEIVAVVANLLENAIEVCGTVEFESRVGVGERNVEICAADRHVHSPTPTPNSNSPKVTCTLRQRDGMFGLTVTNPVPSDFQLSSAGLPCAEPGVGLSSVRRVLDRYAGEWQYTLTNGVLTCELALYAGGSDANRHL